MTAESAERADLAACFGQEAADALLRWARSRPRPLSLRPHLPLWKPSGAGYTGAVLQAIEVGPPNCVVIVKLLPARARENEPEALAEARKHSPPEFFADHLVDEAYPALDLPDGSTAMFQRPAGGDLRDHRPLGNLRGDEFTTAASEVVGGLLTEWNLVTAEKAAQPTDASVFLRRELSTARNEELQDWGRHLGLLDNTSPWFLFGGELLPNPYLAVAGTHPAFRDLTTSVLRGLVHGDAHLDNILVARHRGKSVPSSYRLIDLATFQSNGPLSRDVVTLLLSALVPHVREPMPQDQRHALLRFVVDPEQGHLSHIPPQVVERVDAIRNRADEIMRERDWLAPWGQQFLLSLQAGALAFTTYTNIGEHGRAWFALLAAHAGAQVLHDHRRALPAATGDMPGAQWAWKTPFERITPFPLPGGTSAPRSRASTDQVGTAPLQYRWSVRTTMVRDKTATVGFGPDNTVVVVDGHGGVHRWADDGTAKRTHREHLGTLRLGHQALVSSLTHSIAVAESQRLHLVHFDENDRGSPPAAPVSLGRGEFLVTSGGDVLATHDHKRLVLRDFERGSVLGTVPVPEKLAASAISADGSVIALATSRTVTIHRQGARLLEKKTRNSLPHLRGALRHVLPRPGCWLAISPSGSHVACVTFEEVVVWRLDDDTVSLRRNLTTRESRDGLGAAQMRLVCTDAGTVLWLRRGRLVCVSSGPESRQVEQTGYYNDFAVSRDGFLVAGLNDAGTVELQGVH